MLAYILTCLIFGGILFLVNYIRTRHLYKNQKIKFLKSYKDQDFFNTYEAEKLADPSLSWESNLKFAEWIIERSSNQEHGKKVYYDYLEDTYDIDNIVERIFWRSLLIFIAWIITAPFFYEFPSWEERFVNRETYVIRTNSSDTRVIEVFPLPNTGIFQLPLDDVYDHMISVPNSDPGFEKTGTISIRQTINGDPREFKVEFVLKTEDYLRFLIQVNNSGTYKSSYLQDETLVFNNFRSIVEKSSLPARELANSLDGIFDKWLTDRGITSAQVKVLSIKEHSDRQVSMY